MSLNRFSEVIFYCKIPKKVFLKNVAKHYDTLILHASLFSYVLGIWAFVPGTYVVRPKCQLILFGASKVSPFFNKLFEIEKSLAKPKSKA